LNNLHKIISQLILPQKFLIFSEKIGAWWQLNIDKKISTFITLNLDYKKKKGEKMRMKRIKNKNKK
jgi:hypothetical protein